MPNLITRYASPKYFAPLAKRLAPWMGAAFALFLVLGLYWGLFVAPPDAKQGDAYRIMFVHVPAAWMSMFVYVVMAFCALGTLVWRAKVPERLLLESSFIGASFTFLALVTGSLWGKPMWGTWWVWDARLTSELVLLFIYIALIALEGAVPDRRKAARVVAMLTLVGSVNLPIIKFSVDWWNTLHQPASVFRKGGPSIAAEMLTPLFLIAIAFTCFYFWLVLGRIGKSPINEGKEKTS